MKLCIDCKHFKYFHGGYKGICSSPKLDMSPIDGKPNYRFAAKMRKDYTDTASYTESCGTEGNWWEPKPSVHIEQPKKPWYKF